MNEKNDAQQQIENRIKNKDENKINVKFVEMTSQCKKSKKKQRKIMLEKKIS